MERFELVQYEAPYFVIDLGDGEFGIVMPETDPAKVEIWFNHNFDGSGCNNLRIDAFGQELDLEFCRSRPIESHENEALVSALFWDWD